LTPTPARGALPQRQPGSLRSTGAGAVVGLDVDQRRHAVIHTLLRPFDIFLEDLPTELADRARAADRHHGRAIDPARWQCRW
jgi:hypothetical protein